MPAGLSRACRPALERVRAGDEAANIRVVGSGDAAGGWLEGELEDLERQGIVVRGVAGPASELARPGPKVKGGCAVKALLDERRGGR